METDVAVDDDLARSQQVERAMVEAGVSPSQPVPVDYFGFDETLRFYLPDGVSWIDHKILNEGARRKYLNKVNRDVRIQKGSGDAIMRMSPGDEKVALLEEAIVGWNLTRNGDPVAFNKTILNDFLNRTNPKVVDLIEFEIRKANSWLQADMSVEDLDKEIDRLTELRDQKIKEEEGKASS
jgi:hypothetical protein